MYVDKDFHFFTVVLIQEKHIMFFSFSTKDVPDGWAVCVSSSLSDPRALRSTMHLHPSF